MTRRCVRLGLLGLCWLGLLAGASAQSGPGLPHLVYPERELFTIISTLGSGNHGHSVLVDGYLGMLQSDVGVEFYDVSNPYAPVLVQSVTNRPGMDLSEPHTHAETTAFGGLHVLMTRGTTGLAGLGGTGYALWDLQDIFNPVLTSAFDLPGVPGGYASGLFWVCLQAPYIYCPVGSQGLIVVDASDPANPVVANQIPKSQLGGFNTVTAFAIGNLLILNNTDGGPGYARLDISDPVNPVLLHSTTNTVIPYGAQVNGGKLLIPALDACAICPGGLGGSFRVTDVFDPSIIYGQFPTAARGASVVLQDQFAHVGASSGYVKVDISNPGTPYFPYVGYTLTQNVGGDFDWVTPLGNLVSVGDDQGYGTQLIPHQALPDNVGPSVTMVVPEPNATNQALTSRIGITLSDLVQAASIDSRTFIVRAVGGLALAGSYSHQFGVVNFSPNQPLLPNTTYEVVIPSGGMKDLAGNTVPVAFQSRFSTGAQVNPVSVTVQRNGPAVLGSTLGFGLAAATGTGLFQYSWDFGDGTPSTAFSSSSRATHTYASAGHYSVLCRATNGSVTVTDSYIQTIHHRLTPTRPQHSSTIAFDEVLQRAWCVNADNDTVTAIDAQTLAKIWEVPVGAHPRTLAMAPDGTLWVVCQDEPAIYVLDATLGKRLTRIPLRTASAPYGVVMSPDGASAYVTLSGTGEVVKLDPLLRKVMTTVGVGPEPRGIAVAADSKRVFVTRFISSSTAGEMRELSDGDPGFALVRTIHLAIDPGPDTETSGRGLPNYVSSATITPDGRRLWVPSKKDNILRGQFRSGETLNFESTVRTIVSQIDLTTGQEDLASRIDFNNRDMAFAVAFNTHGDYAFHALQGSNAVDVRDAYSGHLVATIEGTGRAPQGLLVTSNDTLFVHNFMSRSVSIYDVRGVTSATSFAMPLLASVTTVANEKLAPPVLQGKQIFYNAADPRMNQDGYISCASCHLDGGHDGRVWDFTDRGEGLRNTISLQGKGGMAHGRVHWTANFDEIQDFEHDIRGGFGGDGFIPQQLFTTGTVGSPLGQPKAGLSPELDALAAYVTSLNRFGRSPFRGTNGHLTESGDRGRLVFQQQNCAQCHGGPTFRDGLVHDVGTIKPGSGQASGAPLLGFDTPTLRGLWATGPYLHDGSAPTLVDVLSLPGTLHGNPTSLTAQQRQDLVAYLLQIDDLEPSPN